MILQPHETHVIAAVIRERQPAVAVKGHAERTVHLVLAGPVRVYQIADRVERLDRIVARIRDQNAAVVRRYNPLRPLKRGCVVIVLPVGDLPAVFLPSALLLLASEYTHLRHVVLDYQHVVIVEVRDDQLAVVVEAYAARRVQVAQQMRLTAEHTQRDPLGAEQLDAVVPGVRDRDLAV